MKSALFAALFLVACVAGLQPQSQTPVPREIEDYYRNQNFIALYSTREERVALTGGGSHRRDAPAMNPARRTALLEAMAAVERREIRREDTMPNPFARDMEGPDSARWSGSVAYAVPEIVSGANGRITLTVGLIYPEPGVQRYLIDGFELRPGKPFPAPGPLTADGKALAGKGVIMGKEIHRWLYSDGSWKKEPTLVVLVGDD